MFIKLPKQCSKQIFFPIFLEKNWVSDMSYDIWLLDLWQPYAKSEWTTAKIIYVIIYWTLWLFRAVKGKVFLHKWDITFHSRNEIRLHVIF